MKKVIIFGAGKYGEEALKWIGEKNVHAFVDNDTAKIGGRYCGKPVLAPERCPELIKEYQILIAVMRSREIEKQLEAFGISDVPVFIPGEYMSFLQFKQALSNIGALSLPTDNQYRICLAGSRFSLDMMEEFLSQLGLIGNIRKTLCTDTAAYGRLPNDWSEADVLITDGNIFQSADVPHPVKEVNIRCIAEDCRSKLLVGRGVWYDRSRNALTFTPGAFARSLPWFYYKAYDQVPTPDLMEDLTFVPKRIILNDSVRYAGKGGRYFHIKDGFRQTVGQPESCEHTVYILGNSQAAGNFLEDRDTIPSNLQRLFNKNSPGKYAVKNLAVGGASISSNVALLLSMEGMKPGDTVIFTSCYIKGEVVENRHRLQFKLLSQAKDYAERSGAAFYFFYLPTVCDIHNKNVEEQMLISCFDKNTDVVYESRTYLDYLSLGGIRTKDLSFAVQRPHDHGSLFVDIAHYSPKGSRLIAEEIFKFIQKSSEIPGLKNTPVSELDGKEMRRAMLTDVYPFLKTEAGQNFIEKLRGLKTGDADTGAIVMNANPFTKGHQYLVEMAAAQVEQLYVFVLEEDSSFFRFTDRFNMVKAGTAHLLNVTVVPSGRFIISSATFPEYFDPDQKYREDVNTLYDISIFGNIIAPVLNITKRFVGSEPFSPITNSYNVMMKEYLPQYGVEVLELDRYCQDSRAVSATAVRELYGKWDFAGLEPLVPETTLNYLKNMVG